MRWHNIQRWACGLLGACLLMTALCSVRADGAAETLTERCSVSAPIAFNRKSAARMTDGARETHATLLGWTGFSVRLPAGETARSLYMEWMEPQKKITVQEYDDAGKLLRSTQYLDSTLDCGYPLTAQTARVRVRGGFLMKVANLALIAADAPPESERRWLPAAEKCDLLVVSAHCDDELLFFGGAIPYYAGERGYTVQVAYMAHGERMRQGEAMDGLWLCGVRNDPVFLGFPDIYFDDQAAAEKAWGRERTLEALVSLLRRTRPEVALTHGLDGEYGHGAHRITAHCMLDAVKLAADPAAYPKSAAAYGPWQVKKLYLHVGQGDNRIVMRWDVPLAAFGGKTAIQTADDAYHMHASQLYLYSDVYNPGLNNSDFGLYATTVGPDVAKDDFFEHVPGAALTARGEGGADGAE